MTYLMTLLVLAGGVLLTMRGIPWMFRTISRLLGFKFRTSPLAEKRLRRFRSIRRGYISFVIVTSMFTTSLFLEVLVNDRPIMIRYGENRAFPAVRDLANTWLFFIDGPFRTFDRSEDYGIPGEGPLDYKAFGGIVADPAGSFGPIEQQRLQELKGLSEEISQTQQEVDELLEDGDEPEEWLVEDLDAARDDLKRLEFQIENFDSIKEVFVSGGASIIWPLYRHGPRRNRLDLPGTAPHGPSLPIPGITPRSSTATLISQTSNTIGGKPTYEVMAADEASLTPGQKFFVVEGGGGQPVTDVVGILLVRESIDVAGLQQRIAKRQPLLDDPEASDDAQVEKLRIDQYHDQQLLSLVQQQHGDSGQIGIAEVLAQSEGKKFPAQGILMTRFLDTWEAPLGTSDSGIDVLPLLLYGFRISVGFALMVMGFGYVLGILAGAIMGYYGGWTDILLQRFIEIWGSVPFLFLIMIIASIVDPGFWMLVIFLVILRSWMAVTYQIRGEFYREKAKDYVQAAIGTGVSDFKVMIRHILPNSMIPVISRAPFSFVNYISALVSLDFLGFGLPPTDPSWGRLLNQGFQFLLIYPHLVLLPVMALAVTLFLVVLIGEAVREAFDPKVFSRLR
jgi:ABC-type microcin C transport system permease subunit YejE